MPPNDRTTEILEGMREALTGGLKEINTDHALIHDGIGFRAYIRLDSMTSEQVVNYSFKTHATKYPHLKDLHLQVLGASVTVEIIDGITYSADAGTAVPIKNMNRNSAVTAGSTIKAGPTFSGTEEVIATITAMADTTNQTVGIADITTNGNQELVLENDHEYIIRITNEESASIGVVILSGFFYEETAGITP